MNFRSLEQLYDFFKDERTCLEYYENIRWKGNPTCPFCKSDKPYVTDRGYKCSNNECHKKFTVKVGTIFENTKIPLRTWYGAIYLCTAHKKGISSYQLATNLDITQKTAWFVLHRIREMLKTQAPQMLTGTTEVDATFIGGKEKFKHKNKRSRDAEGNYVNIKKVVLGAIERDGKIILQHIPSETKEHMVDFVTKHIDKGSTVYTDEHQGFRGLGKIYTHDTVNHSIKLYVSGIVHTNTIENFWSLLKRGLNGTYHQVSEKHLNRYLQEFASRFNSRTDETQQRFEKFLRKSERRLTYKRLVGKY